MSEEYTCIPAHLHASRIYEKININKQFKELMKVCIETLENCETFPCYMPAWFKKVHSRFEIREKYPSAVIRMIIGELNKAGYIATFEELKTESGGIMQPCIIINVEPTPVASSQIMSAST